MSDYILEVKNIYKAFLGTQALSDVSLNLRKGEVMGILGENGAGKSTLMKILLGLYKKDSGEIIYKGKPFEAQSPHMALTNGISMIHQEINLIETTTVGENIWIGREDEFIKFGLINTKKRNQAADELLGKLGITTISSKEVVSDLSVANKQLVEITRAVGYKSDIIIMDEPTSALTNVEIEMLYKIIGGLKEKGTSIIFISHKLDEILTICDRVTVFRDGHSVATVNVKETNNDQLISYIVGRTVTDIYPKPTDPIGQTRLEVKNLSGEIFSNVNFSIKKGEILGFCGLIGAGRSEIARAVFGLDKKMSGEILIDSKSVQINSVHDAIKHGIGMVNEDRRGAGIFAGLGVKENVTIAELENLVKGGFINSKKENQKAEEYVNSMNVKCSSISQTIGSLSGGNQQKAVIARWLMINPKILILDEPTRGIDIGAKIEIYKLINKLASEGMAILLISSELPELMGVCNRIIVIRDGKQVGEHVRQNFNQELLMKDAFGG